MKYEESGHRKPFVKRSPTSETSRERCLRQWAKEYVKFRLIAGWPGWCLLVPEVQQHWKSRIHRGAHTRKMAELRVHVLLLLIVTTTLVSSMPHPGGGGHEHTHFVIHAPHHIHKHHHTHVKKIYIPVKSHDDDDHGHIEHEEW